MNEEKDQAIDVITRRREVVSAYQRMFDSPEGQIVLHDMMKAFNFFGTSASQDPYETHFNEGQRSVILTILGVLKTDSEKYAKHIQNIKENQDVNYFNYAENTK